jgi:nucleoside-diphosphate-sugar epimerase
MAATKPRILVLGGLGFIGKHLVKHLVDNDLASKIRVVDKIMLAMARLGQDFNTTFDKVECIQANLRQPESVAKAFADPEGDYNIVINLAAETKLAQTGEVYAEGITKVAVVCAQEAIKHKVERFIHVSTAEVYKPSSKALTEDSPLGPTTGIGTAHLKAEEELKAFGGALPLVIVRPAICYGPGDILGLAPRLCIAAVYKKTGIKMEYPEWFESTQISTAHVGDVARAIWVAGTSGEPGKIYNVADKNDTDQKKLNIVIEKLFGIQTGHLGTLKSEALKLMPTKKILKEVNGEHAPTWSTMLTEAKLDYSPLSPWLEGEALSNNDLHVDGSAIEKLGFQYQVPAVTEESIRGQLQHAVQEGWFPPGIIA